MNFIERKLLNVVPSLKLFAKDQTDTMPVVKIIDCCLLHGKPMPAPVITRFADTYIIRLKQRQTCHEVPSKFIQQLCHHKTRGISTHGWPVIQNLQNCKDSIRVYWLKKGLVQSPISSILGYIPDSGHVIVVIYTMFYDWLVPNPHHLFISQKCGGRNSIAMSHDNVATSTKKVEECEIQYWPTTPSKIV